MAANVVSQAVAASIKEEEKLGTISERGRGDGEASAPRGHLVIARTLEIFGRFHEFLDFRLVLKSLMVGGELGQIGQAARFEHLVLFQHLPQNKISPREAVAGEPFVIPKEVFERLQRLFDFFRIFGAFDFEVSFEEIWCVTHFDEASAKISQLLRRLITSVLLLVRLAHEIVLPG